MTCQEVDRLVTLFIDGECTEAERTAIASHLRDCESCRIRVEAESAAKDVLHAHARAARMMGQAPAWRPRVFRLGKPILPVRPGILVFVASAALVAFGIWLRPAPVIAVGVVGDSICTSGHDGRFPNRRSDRDCVLGCVRGGAEFVLITDQRVYRIRNQEFSELAAFANARVKVEGALDGDRLVIAKLTAADGSTAPSGAEPQ